MTKKHEEEGKKKQGAVELSEKQKDFNEFFLAAVKAQKTSCFWDKGDWRDRWNLQSEYNLPKQEIGDQSEGFQSKVKSPEVIARNHSTRQKLAKLNIGFIVRPKVKGAKLGAQIDQEVLNHFFKQGLFRKALDDSFQTAINHGTAPIGVEWVRKTRKVQMPITKADEMTEKQKKDVKDGKMPSVKVTKVDYRGPVLVPYELPNVYFDPTATCVQGHVNACDHVFVTEMMPYKKFKAEFSGKAGYKNVDVVQSITSAHQSEEGASLDGDSFMTPPIDSDGEFVFVVRGWCYSDDWYIVKANNVFIKESFIPYSDKKIPIDIIKPYSHPHQLYGIAPVDLLIPTIYQMELMMNTLFDYAIYTSNPVLLVDKQDYGDFSRKYEIVNGRPGALLPVTSSSQSVSPLKYPSLNVDIFQGLERLQRDAVIATQHDPSQLGLVNKDATATANIMNKEILEAYIEGILLSFKTNLESVATMVISRLHQFLRRADIEKIVFGDDDEGEVDGGQAEGMRESRIPISGKSIEVDWDERTLKIQEDPNKVTVVKITPDIYEYEGEDGELLEVTANDYEVELSAESLEMVSQALEQQQMMESFGQLIPFAVNPQNPQAAMQNPLGMIDAQVLFQEFVEKLKLNQRLLISPTDDEKSAVKKAERQNMEMFSGQRAMPEAGESQAHIQTHTKFQKHLTEVFENLKGDIEDDVMSGIEIEQEKKDEFDRLRLVIPIVGEHIDFDMTPALLEGDRVAQESQQGMQQQGAGMPQPGMGQAVSESGMGGSMPAPNLPQAAGMTQGGPGDMPPQAMM